MTDDLVKRLRSMHWCVTTETNGVGVSDRNVALEAADRIEQLTAKLAKAEGGMREIAAECGCSIARVTLAVLKGETP